MQTSKSINVRLSERSYAALRGLADARGTSMNKAIEDSIEAMATAQRKARLRTAFAALAGADHDVEFAQEAQAEVALASE